MKADLIRAELRVTRLIGLLESGQTQLALLTAQTLQDVLRRVLTNKPHLQLEIYKRDGYWEVRINNNHIMSAPDYDLALERAIESIGVSER